MSALVTLADVKQWLGITTTSSDALLTKLIAGASAAIEKYVGQTLSSQAYVEDRDGTGNRRIMASASPVTAVAVVKVDDVTQQVSPNTQTAGYVFDEDSISLRGGRVFCKGVQNIHLEYTAGYAVIPEDIQQACIELVGLKFGTKDTSAKGVSSKTLATESITYSARDMNSSTRTILNQYKREFAV